MATTPGRLRGVQSAGPRAGGASPRDVLRMLARIGLIARGVVYGVIGILALELATGSGGKATSQTGALHTIARQSFGGILLLALAVGLGAYSLWRLIEGVAGSRPGDDGATLRRVAAIGSGIAYGILCYTAIEILAGAHTGGGSPHHATAGILAWPGGPVLVAIAGLIVIAVGGYQARKGLGKKFLEDADTGRMSAAARRTFTALGVAGHVARAVTFVLIGYGLIRSALDYSAKTAVGLDGALKQLVHASAGPFLLAIVAIAFIAFALYSIADSRYHRV